MPGSMSPWAQGLAWTALYALVVWGVSVVETVVGDRREGRGLQTAVAWGRFLLPLVLAFLIGLRLRAWWWIAGPPVAIVLVTLTYSLVSFLSSPPTVRQETGSALILAVFLTAINAGWALLAAVAGIVLGRALLD